MWPYANSGAFSYLPFNQRASIGQANDVNRPGVHSMSQPTFSPAYSALYPAYNPRGSGSSSNSSSIGETPSLIEEEIQITSPASSKRYDRWTNEQQSYLVQLWADKQDQLNSKDSRVAWRDIAELINLKFATDKTIDKCQRKMKYLIDAYKEKKEWNKNQTGGNLRKSVFYDEIDAVLGCRDIVTLRHVLDAGAHDSSTRSSSSDSETSSVNVIPEINREKETIATPKTRTERKKGQGKRKRKLEDANDEEYEVHHKRTIDDIKSQGERVVSCMEKMQEMQMQQMQFMNQFMGNFLQAFKDK